MGLIIVRAVAKKTLNFCIGLSRSKANWRVCVQVIVNKANRNGVAQLLHTLSHAIQCFWVATQSRSAIPRCLDLV